MIGCLLFSLLPASIFFVASLAFLLGNGFTLMEILRDPAQQSGQSSFLGFLSNIGVWLWVSSTAICFFSLFNSKSSIRGKEMVFLVGTFSSILAVDDFFMIHDRYVDQKLCYLAYALTAGALLVRHFRKIIAVDSFSFILAGTLLALSIGTDLIQSRIPLPYSIVQVFEEGFKFVGGAVWLYFCSQISIDHLTSVKSRVCHQIDTLDHQGL
ncbi:oxidase [filamentous cyanobacterium LEGE 11480]|uniref:Oxidase n=1 Tax=Romeriopsis navalis LEGE 11480 TaxID=2777977 RepID=A0A928VKY4_9CYAN|nr:oxidase [Romeriopsis navalis LEGE 11480]